MPRHKEVEEFEEAALPHLNDLYRTARHLTGDGSRAEDVVQETCVEALKSFRRFTPGTNMRAWLFGIMFNVVRHQRRKWLRFRTPNEPELLLQEKLTAPCPIPERLTDKSILAALDSIPQQFREVVLLVDVDDFSYKEAAGILGVPTGTVMSRLSRARGLLRRELSSVARDWGIAAAAEGGAS